MLHSQSPVKWLYPGKITCFYDKRAWLKERSEIICIVDCYIPSDVLINCLRFFGGLMKTPLLSSAGFVCLRDGYREVFWEEFSRLT